MSVGTGRRGRIGTAREMEVDFARDQRLVHRGNIADDLGALENTFRRFGELGHLFVGVLLERIEAGDAAQHEYVPVVGFEYAVFLGVGRIVPEIPSLVLGGGAADLVGIDNETIRSKALDHAQKLGSRIIHRPFVRRFELRQHLLEIGFEAGTIERLDQLLRVHDFARPRVIHVDEIPDIDLTGSQPVDHRGIIGEGFGLHRSAAFLAEGIKHLSRVVPFPAKNIQLFFARRGGTSRQYRSTGRECGGPKGRLLHEVAAGNPYTIGHSFLPAGL